MQLHLELVEEKQQKTADAQNTTDEFTNQQ